MQNDQREYILTSDCGSVTVRRDDFSNRVYLSVDDDFAKTEMCLSLAQHEQLITSLQNLLPDSVKQAEIISLVRDAYTSLQSVGWAHDKESIAKLKKALSILEGK